MKLVYLLLLVIELVTAQQDLQCHIEGQCMGVAIDFFTTDSYNDCLDRCKENANCNWITHYGDTSGCVAFNDCPSLDYESCTNCYSGQAGCQSQEPVCNIPGICNGHLVAYNHTESVESCLEFCQSTEGCNWYSYKVDTMDCFLTEDCLIMDDTCTNCLAGERECQLGNTGGIIGNTIFVVGGGGASNKVEVVDLVDGGQSCSNLAEYPRGSDGSVGTFIDNSNIVCGGFFGLSSSSNKCYTYHPGNDTWTETYSMVQGRTYSAAVMVSPTKWWITGGYNDGGLSSTEMFTAGEGFSPYGELPTALYQHNFVKVNDTHYMLLGGCKLKIAIVIIDITVMGDTLSDPATNQTWLFNMDTETWESLPDLLVTTSFPQAGLVTHSNGTTKVAVAAGQDTAATQIFSLDSQTWRMGPNFPSGNLARGASVPYDNTFLIVGGFISGTGLEDKIWKYEINTGDWMELPQKLDLARYNTAAFLVQDDFITCDAPN